LLATEIRQIASALHDVRQELENSSTRLSGLKSALYAIQADTLSGTPMDGEEASDFIVLLVDVCDGLLSRLTESGATLAKACVNLRDMAGDPIHNRDAITH